MATADWYRSAGSFASARRTTRSRSVGDLGPELGRRLRDLGEVLHRDLHRRVARERDLGGQELVEDDAGRVEVGRLVDGRPARLLGREVLRGPDDRALLRHLARAGPGDPEVGHLDDALGVDDDVVRLDVAMDDAVPVRVAERGEDLARVRDRHRTGHGPRLRRSSFSVLPSTYSMTMKYEPSVSPRSKIETMFGCDEPGGVRRLASEALDELLVVRVARVQDLDRDPPPELLVLGEVDVGHPAASELARDAVAPREERSGEGVLGRHRSVPRG